MYTRVLPIVLSALLSGPAAALTLTATDQGWWAGTRHFRENYAAGRTVREYRDYFVFDLSPVSGPIATATLRLFNPTNGFSSQHATEIYSLFDVTTSLRNLINGLGGIVAFTDLGSGTVFGSVVVSTADNGTYVNVALNADGLAALNARLGKIGKKIAFGGAITTLDDSQRSAYVFGFSGTERVQLLLTLSEPGTVPVADAGDDQVIDCALPTGAQVSLDATGSSDANLEPLTYSWTDTSLGLLSTEAMPTLLLPPGMHLIMLTVDDGVDGSATDEVVITVNADVKPPELVLAKEGDELWPPNRKLHGYDVADLVESASDECSGDLSADVVFGSASSDESDYERGDGSARGDVQFSDDCRTADLRAERSAGGDGRVYELVLEVADTAGNMVEEVFTVAVPHDRAHAAGDSGDVADYASECAEAHRELRARAGPGLHGGLCE